MIIYNVDGSIKEYKNSDFGWKFVKQRVRRNNIILLKPNVQIAPIEKIEDTILDDKIYRQKTFRTVCGEIENCMNGFKLSLGYIKKEIEKDKLHYQQHLQNRCDQDDNVKLDKLSDLHWNLYTKYGFYRKCKNPKCDKFIKNDDVTEIRNQLENFCHITCEMHFNLKFIRVCFKREEIRLQQLIQEAIRLRCEMVECNFLDEFIALLMGKPERINSKGWPFKIGRSPNKNLII